MKKIFKTIFLLIFLLNISLSYAENDYTKLDIKIEKVQNKILDSKKSDTKKIRVFNIVIKKLVKIEKKLKNNTLSTEDLSLLKNKEKLKLVKYINNKFKTRLLEFKTKNNLLNKLIFSSEIGEISDYKVYNSEFIIGNKNYFILRGFTQNDIEKYLIVEDKTYNTFIIGSSYITDLTKYGKKYTNSSYKNNLDLVYKNRISGKRKGKNYLQNAGLKSGLNNGKNIYLTADFCPSAKHGFENNILEKYSKIGNKNITIFITESWILKHSKDFNKLIELNNSNKLNIIWGNHTKTHKYNYSNSFGSTFILTPGLKLENEFLDVEKILIKNGQIPSIFMRFPGLISDEKIFKETIYKYGLIPVGSDTWLAKGEKIKENSIILIHGNKNEPRGIEIFDKILDEKSNLYYNNINNILK